MNATQALQRRITLRLLPFLFLLYIVAYLDRVNVGFAQLQMGRDLRFSAPIYGFGAGVFFLGYFLFEIPSNLILERYGARRWIARIMITWGIVAMAMMFMRTPHEFFALRFLLGIAEAGFFPGIILYLTYWFPAAERARAVAQLMTATTLSSVVGGPISGALLKMGGAGGLRGWQWLFLLEGLPAVLLGFVVLAYLPDGPRSARWLSDSERAQIAEWLASDAETAGTHDAGGPMQALKSPAVWLFTLTYLGIVIGGYGLQLWMPEIVKSLGGLNDFQTGCLTAAPYLAAAIGMVIVGISSDRTGERRWHIALPAFAAVAGLLAAAALSQPSIALIGVSVALVGESSTLGPFWATSTAALRSTAAAGGIAFINSVGNLGGFLGPYVVGRLVAAHAGRAPTVHDFAAGFHALAFALGVAGVLALAGGRVRRAQRVLKSY